MRSNTALLVARFAPVLLASYVINCASVPTSNLKVAIVNKDAEQTDSTCKFQETCSFQQISCRYLAHLDQQPVSKAYYTSVNSTVQALKTSELDVSAVVYFNENYTDAFVAKMALGEDADAETVNSGQIHVWLNAAQRADQLKQYIQTAFDHFVKDVMKVCSFAQYDNDNGRFSFRNFINYHYV
ncbi:uncharacterized protein LOC120634299 [Pararge aegeria]|uniref:uncharacterized protein LOC120634299 n=1 Tax=Pararge aegeria TaxID=116150 RepID=UPI0019D225EC|nr:uncharacterized protein LOC120634299 [Pararge aegeria]